MGDMPVPACIFVRLQRVTNNVKLGHIVQVLVNRLVVPVTGTFLLDL